MQTRNEENQRNKIVSSLNKLKLESRPLSLFSYKFLYRILRQIYYYIKDKITVKCETKSKPNKNFTANHCLNQPKK